MAASIEEALGPGSSFPTFEEWRWRKQSLQGELSFKRLLQPEMGLLEYLVRLGEDMRPGSWQVNIFASSKYVVKRNDRAVSCSLFAAPCIRCSSLDRAADNSAAIRMNDLFSKAAAAAVLRLLFGREVDFDSKAFEHSTEDQWTMDHTMDHIFTDTCAHHAPICHNLGPVANSYVSTCMLHSSMKQH